MLVISVRAEKSARVKADWRLYMYVSQSVARQMDVEGEELSERGVESEKESRKRLWEAYREIYTVEERERERGIIEKANDFGKKEKGREAERI